MGTIKLNPSQYAGWIDRMAADFPQVMRSAVVSGAMAALPELHLATDKSPPPSGVGNDGAMDRGRYKRSWKAGQHPEGAWIYNDAPYAAVIEHGRRPGARRPPVKALIAWCKRKAKADDPAAMAYLLARAIGRRGIKSRNVMSGALPQITRRFEAEVMRVLARRFGGQP